MSIIPYHAKIHAGNLETKIHDRLNRLEETVKEMEHLCSVWAWSENRYRTLTLEQFMQERRVQAEEDRFEWHAAQECRRDAIERDRLGLW
jgi:hypothetical protein